MDNAEDVLQILEEFSKRKPKYIPPELDDYMAYVARTGDPVYQWAMVKSLFKEKLMNVISDFNETSPGMEIPPYPNVDPFNYETMKESLIERLDSFIAAPFTVQRICELLMYPRKQYNRIDKFMRAIEKNILVVSTREPGLQRHAELENGEPQVAGEGHLVNGSDTNSYTDDIDMEDVSWKDKPEQNHTSEPQSSTMFSSDVSDENIDVHLETNDDSSNQKKTMEYESITPPDINVTEEPPAKVNKTEPDTESVENQISQTKDEKKSNESETQMESESDDVKSDSTASLAEDVERKVVDETKSEVVSAEPNLEKPKPEPVIKKENIVKEEEDIESFVSQEITEKADIEKEPLSDKGPVESSDDKIMCDMEELSESSSENSSSSEGNTNSPKTDGEAVVDVQEEVNTPEVNVEFKKVDENTETPAKNDMIVEENSDAPLAEEPEKTNQQEEYSVADVKSTLPIVNDNAGDVEASGSAGQALEETPADTSDIKEVTSVADN